MGRESRLRGIFGGAASPPPLRVRDAVNRVLEIGDEVLVVNPSTPMRVATIAPVLAPGAPPGMVMLTLVTRMAIAVPADQSVENLYFLRHQAEIGDGAIPEAEGEKPTEAPQVDAVGDESGPAEKPSIILTE